MSSRVPLTLACWDYDRTRALATGEIRPEGVDLTYLSLPVEETFFRMMRNREFDASEMSLSSYVLSLSRGAPTMAIPVFPSRAFRHNGIYVNAASGIEQPADLAGRLASGEGFTLEDFVEQLSMVRKLGPIGNLLGMLPGAAKNRALLEQVNDKDLDRAEAIASALASAGRDDVVVLSGKGHERTQTGRMGTIPFDDAEVVRAWFRSKKT